MASLDGKRVYITGASSGVGLAAAEAFAKHGCDVAVSARSVDGLERAAASVRRYGRRSLVLPLDVTDQPALDAAVATIEEEWGGLDVLVPNAAITMWGPFKDVSKPEFDRVVEISFLGTVNTVRAGLPALERTDGAVVATGSLMSKLPLPTWSSYSASKWAMRGFLHALRIELQSSGSDVTVSMVHPGSIDTPVYSDTPSALDHGPRRPPEGYHPSVIAEALVGMAKKPRAEITVGAEAKALELLWTSSQQAGDLVMRGMYHYFMSSRRPGSDAAALWEAAGKGVASGDLFGRPSLTLPLRLATLPLRLLR
ncbi:MAG: SDR family NAD(P)-dependent oxidoreductase [Actinomycetota bacterium]|nr:SDR family NAD(P)-dependent oxidoreductase [Actinomycetota bacterium]